MQEKDNADSLVSLLQEKNVIDLFNFKIFGLLMCRGSCSEKASFMFDLIMQQNKEKDPSKRILYWNHPKLRKAIRMLVYISELLPKKNKIMLNQGPGQVKIS